MAFLFPNPRNAHDGSLDTNWIRRRTWPERPRVLGDPTRPISAFLEVNDLDDPKTGRDTIGQRIANVFEEEIDAKQGRRARESDASGVTPVSILDRTSTDKIAQAVMEVGLTGTPAVETGIKLIETQRNVTAPGKTLGGPTGTDKYTALLAFPAGFTRVVNELEGSLWDYHRAMESAQGNFDIDRTI